MATTTQRGYGLRHQQATKIVLARDVLCTEGCGRRSTSAHHDPALSEREDRGGAFASDPSQMRGVCAVCHTRLTSELNRRRMREQNARHRDDLDDEIGTVPPPTRQRTRKYPRYSLGAIKGPPINGPAEVHLSDGTVIRLERGQRYEP